MLEAWIPHARKIRIVSTSKTPRPSPRSALVAGEHDLRAIERWRGGCDNARIVLGLEGGTRRTGARTQVVGVAKRRVGEAAGAVVRALGHFVATSEHRGARKGRGRRCSTSARRFTTRTTARLHEVLDE